LYCEHIETENYYGNKHFLYAANMVCRDFSETFRNIWGAQAVVANIKFQEELFKLEQSGKPLPSRTNRFKPPPIVRCQQANREILIHDYANRESKTMCVDYGLLTHIFEMKHNLGIGTGIVPNINGLNMQKHNDQHKLWAHALAIYFSSVYAINMRTFRSRFDVSKLSRTPVLNVSAYIQKLPNVTSDDISNRDAHLAQTLIRLTTMGVDPETKQASLTLMSSFTGKLGHWARHNTEALYNITFVTQRVELVRSIFVILDYQAKNLNLLVKLE
jgi:hypothetical protein